MKISWYYILFLASIFYCCGSPTSQHDNIPKDAEAEVFFAEHHIPFLGDWIIEYYLDSKVSHICSFKKDRQKLYGSLDGKAIVFNIDNKTLKFENEDAEFEGKLMGKTLWGTLKTKTGPFSNQRISWKAEKS